MRNIFNKSHFSSFPGEINLKTVISHTFLSHFSYYYCSSSTIFFFVYTKSVLLVQIDIHCDRCMGCSYMRLTAGYYDFFQEMLLIR